MLRTVANTPKDVVSALPGASTHGILAASLCLDTSEDLKTWARLFPSRADVRAVMPICWPEAYQALLPAGARDILKAQKARFAKDWALFAPRFPSVSSDEYLYLWLLVNTRTFYYKNAAGAGGKSDENMALQPIADLFNHLPGDHCEAAFVPGEGFRFTANRAYAAGEELYVCYGAHGNDTLLVEYGFSLPGELNAWDEIALFDFLAPLFSAKQRILLKEAGFWGRYALDRNSACYRTQTALRLLCIRPDAWLDVVAGDRDEDMDREVVDARWRTELRKIRAEVKAMSIHVDTSRFATFSDKDVVGATAMRLLSQRWAQILELIDLELERLENPDDDDS
ncbi:Ribosomal N-lysine methyltransferase set11 [Escovopsis weberi]|uniref:Ribosomal N-lysine methyltransferase set11 n=1 Tax=Escovopsis weberi TaxID=150374 RepID=A0A0M9VWS4_ESCWE|nr:Ribosomal N-lysine methyltransferase set11 [Escovopsis weberi]